MEGETEHCNLIKSIDEAVLLNYSNRSKPFYGDENWGCINLVDYGVFPNSELNQYEKLDSVLSVALKGATNVIIRFEQGTYVISPPKGEVYAIDLSGRKNCIIDGSNSLIVCNNPLAGFFRVSRSENIEVRNFKLNNDPVPWTQTRVVGQSVGERYFDVEIEMGSPSLSDPMFTDAKVVWARLMSQEDPTLGKAETNTAIFLKRSWSKIGERVFRLRYTKAEYSSMIEVGDYLVVHARNQVRLGQFGFTKNVTFKNISSNSCGGGFGGKFDENSAILNCRIELGGDNWISALSDAIHFQRSKKGPWVEGCTFEGVSDDIINIYNVGFSVSKIGIRDELEMNELVPRILEGGNLWVESKSTRKMEHNIVIKKVREIEGRQVLVFEKGGLNFSFLDYNFYLSEWAGSDSVIKDNILRNGNRHGVIIMASDSIVEDNHITNCGGSAIKIGNVNRSKPREPYFTLGNTVIRGNRIEGCDFGNTWRQHDSFGSIHVSVKEQGHENIKFAALKDVYVINNIIKDYERVGVYISNLESGAVVGNRIISEEKEFLTVFPEEKAAVKITNSTTIPFLNNEVIDNRPSGKTISLDFYDSPKS